MTFAVATPLILGVGVISIEVSNASRIKSQIQRAADTAVLTAAGARLQSNVAARALGEEVFDTTVAAAVDISRVDRSVTVSGRAGVRKAAIAWRANYKSLIGDIGFGKITEMGGSSAAETGSTSNQFDVHYLVDAGGDMAIIGDPAERRDPNVEKQCDYACHVYGTMFDSKFTSQYPGDYLGLRSNTPPAVLPPKMVGFNWLYLGIRQPQTRLALVGDALQAHLREISQDVAPNSGDFRVALQPTSIGRHDGSWFGWQLYDEHGASPDIGRAMQRAKSMIPIFGNSTAGALQIHSSLARTEQLTAASPARQHVVIITNGLDSEEATIYRDVPFEPQYHTNVDNCTQLKDQHNFGISVIYMPHDLSMGKFDASRDWWRYYRNVISPMKGIAAQNLRRCASLGKFYKADSRAELDRALRSIRRTIIDEYRNGPPGKTYSARLVSP